MTIRDFLKITWYNLSPNYRSLKRIETENLQVVDSVKQMEGQFKSLQNMEILKRIDTGNLQIVDSLKEISTQLESLQTNPYKEGDVYINDYSYTTKHRESLKNSRINELLEHWFFENHEEIVELIQKFCSYEDFYKKIPLHSSSELSPRWVSTWISPFDAISIYSFLAINNPRYYVEVGSGNTTMFAAQSIRDNNLRTKIISIDPYPRAGIDSLCDKIYRIPFENMDMDFFSTLSAEDIFVMDSSHRSFPNSDVTVFFTEVLPKLPSGILYALHDICLPWDYYKPWSSLEKRWYNEQYLLCAYLYGGAGGDKIICPLLFLASKNDIREICNSLWGGILEGTYFGGNFFWLKKA